MVSTELWFSILAAALSGLAAVGVALLSLQSRRKDAAADRSEVVRRLREPLAYATADLQSRLWNILRGRYSNSEASTSARLADYFETNTAFLSAQYLGWVEVLRRETQLLARTRGTQSTLARALDKVLSVWAGAPDDDLFMVLPGEQRAIGEVMISIGQGSSVHVLGYAEFVRRLDDDGDFRRWISPLIDTAGRIRAGERSNRLRDLQHALVDLMEVLDRDGRYGGSEKISRA